MTRSQVLSVGGNSYQNACVCWGRGSPSQWTELPLRIQAIESKDDKKTIRQKREKRKMNETKSWGFEKIKLTNSKHSEEGEKQKAEMTPIIIIGN